MGEFYRRPPGSAQADYEQAKKFEAAISQALGPYVVDKTSSTSELDFRLMGATVVEVKEKRQALTPRWTKLCPDWAPEDVFIIDELTVRKALIVGHPYVFFVLRDVPMKRLFFCSISELVAVERKRVNRGGKGKLLFNLTDFLQFTDLNSLLALIFDCSSDEAWKWSNCLAFGERKVGQVDQ